VAGRTTTSTGSFGVTKVDYADNQFFSSIRPTIQGTSDMKGTVDSYSGVSLGRVLSCEPHSRFVLSWGISADWQHDPNLKTEVEVCIVKEGKHGTCVELEHRHLDHYGERW
jgi:hypothetical protein